MDRKQLANLDPQEIARRVNVDPKHVKKAEPTLKKLKDWMLIAGAILYVLSPLDLIPEAIFGVFGLIDDILVLLLAVIWYMSRQDSSSTSKNNWSSKFKPS